MSTLYDVFLSHATADKAAVEYLALKLREAGIAPFLDKWHLIPGEPWEEALERALDESQTCAVFLGPTGIRGWQNEEMRSALESRVRNKAFRVIPVLLPNSFEPRKEELPRFLRCLTWVDFRAGLDDEEAFLRLVSGIRGTAPGPDGGGGGGGPVKPFRPHSYRSMAQAPEEFVPRREYDKVLEALCPKEGAVQSVTSVGITTALRGAGGFGKTALAQQLCQDERVRENYPNGILWTTMGEDIDANGRLNRVLDLIRWWTQKEPPSFAAAATAGAHLRDLLKESKALIVIDDVWSSADVTPFQGIGNGSALLITTRDSQSLPSDSKKIEVDAMASAEAVSLLRSKLPTGEERDFASLAARLGEWPLLLKMVNRQLRELVQDEGQPVQKALREINEVLYSEGFKAFDRDDPESRHAAASRTILVSVQRLLEKERERYFRLAVFPEDILIPISVLERLWRLGGFKVRKFCRRLHDLSLLIEFDVESGTVRLHDVVRRVLIEKIGDELSDLHLHLLDTFRPASGLWPDLEVEETYLWRNLAGHLLGAKKKDEFRRLLTDLSFLQAKLNATDVNTLMADYQAFVREDRELRLIRDALQLSAHVLTRDRQQLASQLFGRLTGHYGEGIGRILDATQIQLRLRPRQGTLAPAGGALIRILEGHSDWVRAVAVVNGRRAISGSDDRMLRVWDLETGETLRTLEGHSGGVKAVAVMDGRRVVSGSDDRTLRVWDLETGEILRTLEGHISGVKAVAVVNGRQVVSGSDDGMLRVWDLETGETLRTLSRHHSGGVRAVAVVDGRRAISGSDGGTLQVWDLETGEKLRTLEGNSGGIFAVAVVDGCQAISGSENGTLLVWDLETGKILRTKGNSGGIFTVAVVDSRRAISGSDGGTLQVWDLETGATLHTFEGHSGGICAVAVVDGRRAVSSSEDGTLRVWDLEAGNTLRTPLRHSGGVRAVAVWDSHSVLSGDDNGMIQMWDLKTGETLQTIAGWGTVVAVNGHHSFLSSPDGTLWVGNLETGRILTVKERSGLVKAVALVDGHRAVSGSSDRTLRVLDLETGETLRTFKGHSGWVKTVALVDGCRVISGSSDRTLRVWDLETGETLKILEGHTGAVNALAVVDGHRAVSSSDDGALRVWDLETGETLRTLEGHSGGVNAVVVDGRRAISGSNDRTLRVWDLETGKILAVVTLEAPIVAVAVSPDGRIVVAGDQAGRVHFLDWVEPPVPQM